MTDATTTPGPRTPRATGRRRSRGAAAVEFALIAPIFLYLVFGIISYGFMLSFRQAMSQGAAEGARAAAVKPVGTASATYTSVMEQAVTDALGNYNVRCTGGALQHRQGGSWVNAGTCAVSVAACTNNTSVSCATVALNYSYDANPLVPDVMVPLPTTLTFTSVAEVN